MKRVWGFGREKGLSPLGSASGLQRQGRGVRQENNRTDNLLLGYHVRDRDLRKIHKAACVGNVAQVQQILLLGENGVDDRDKMNRTALHLACANGHPEVVTLLVERKCHLNLCDHEKRTALMKAVQCQEEECVNILLENGADPNIRDVSGNTALHYAAFGDNISIIEKLLLYNANTEARNKDNFTPLLVAVNENKQQIVEVLGEKAANIHAEDKLKSSDEIICHHKEEIMLKNSLQSSNPGTDKNAEEDSITSSTEMKIQILGQINSECQRLSGKPGPDDSWPTSASQDFDFDTKYPLPLKVEEKKKHRGSDMEVSENIHDAAVAGLIPQRQNGKADNHQLPITEKKDSDRSEPGLHRKKLKEGENEKGTSKGSVITPVLKKADSLTGGPLQKNDGSHFSEKDQHESRPAKKISKKKNKVKKQITSKDDLVDFIQSSETASEDCGLPYSKNFTLLTEQLGMDCKGTDKNAEEDSITSSTEMKIQILGQINSECQRLSGKPGPDDSWPTSASQDFDFDTKVEEKKKHRGSDMEVSENIHDAAVAGLIPQRQNGKADNHQLPITEKKDSDRSEPGLHRKKLKEGENEKGTSKGSVITPVLKKADSLTGGPLQKNDGSHFSEKDQHESRPAKKISKKKNKVKKQITSKDDLVDFIQSSETASEDCGLPYSKNFTLLTEQLGMDCKGTDKNAEEDSITSSTEMKIQILGQINSECQRLSGKPGPDDSWPTSTSQDFDFDTKEGTAKSAMEAKQDGVGIIENVPPEQTLNDSLTSAGGVHKNYRSDMMSALELGEEEDVESPSLPEYPLPLKVEEKKKHRGSDMEVSENIHDAAVAGLIPQRQNGKADNHQLPITEKKDSDRSEPGLHRKKLKEGENEKGTSKGSVITPVLKKADSLTGGPLQKNDGSHFSEKDQHESRPAKKISKKKNKVKKQITSKDDLVDFIQSSETASEDCGLPYSKNFMLLIEQLGMDCKDSAGFLKIQNILVSYKRLRKLNKNHCKRVTGKIKKMEKTVSALQNELREAKDVTSRLEHQKVEWEHEVCSLRFSLKQEEEKRRNADLLYEKSREKLRRIEDQYKKEVETKQEFELALRTRNMELKAAKDNLNQLSDSREEIQDLLHKNHMLQDEIAMLRLERDTIKNQNQRKETKYCEDIESVKEKNDNLQKTIKQNEETLSKTIFRYSGQLNVLTAEITMLKSKLENEKQNKESLEAEVESYRARLATAVHNHDQSQTSRRDLELAFQRARDEDGHLQDQMNVDVSKLQDKNEVLSRQLSQDESKFNALEIELHHTKDALREKTLVLECVQRDLSQTQCQKMEIEHMYQKEQSNMNKYIAKQESFEERLSQLQSENMLLRQQLDAAHNQADSEEKLVIDMQDQFQNIPKYLKAKREEQGLMLGERNKELTDECKHLKERMYKYKNEKKKLEVVVRELQQKLADTLKKQSMSHASPEVVSHLRLEDETRDLKKKLGRIRSQADVLTTELETTSSKCLQLDAKNQILQQELLSMKAFEEEREKLESNNKKLQREVVNLKQFMEMNMVERSQVEQYKREIEERARLDTVQKLHEVNLFLQAQAAAQENLDQLRENAHASTRSQMELRIKDLESQVSTVKTSQDSTKTELETYRQLYLEELKVRKSLRSELNRTNERLSESNTKLLAERQQHQTSLRTLTMSLGLETPYCGHFGNNSVLNGNLTPRRNLVIPTLNPRPSYAYWETSLWKMQRELEKGVTRALEEGMLPKMYEVRYH
ncbi:ankyrin repeat domain-containing protein 26-like isoform X7 [Felis catus]|uniref:ankyrin repeat domain-containing protein 26-like isoform X7 n=1 Tax=Felis catus TaxID=9685 RepID=UPI001D19C0B0|nr:ankyrin repeat domain-containing protein 26-like isoform X7 [Felis catus]